ncbi:MAG: LysM peptidoglycan-binding domain-containing protein [Planctomycetes bacterium]|nr:LysM peptidoglycan-binding domain-containing protein [Planctomycetota bacterium]
MGKLLKAVLLLALLGGAGTYVLVRQFAPGKTPAEKVENTKQELRNVREMVEAALPKAPPGGEGAGLDSILGSGAKALAPSETAPRELEGTVEASAPAVPPGHPAAPPSAPARPGAAAAPAAAPAAGPAPEAGRPTVHVVAAGETLNLIADRYLGSSGAWPRIVEANPGMDPDRLRVGQKLNIPPDPAAAAAAPAPPAAPAPAAATARKYKVKPGDTLSAIARRELGDEKLWKEIPPLNPGMDPDRLCAGKEIVLPGEAGRR